MTSSRRTTSCAEGHPAAQRQCVPLAACISTQDTLLNGRWVLALASQTSHHRGSSRQDGVLDSGAAPHRTQGACLSATVPPSEQGLSHSTTTVLFITTSLCSCRADLHLNRLQGACSRMRNVSDLHGRSDVALLASTSLTHRPLLLPTPQARFLGASLVKGLGAVLLGRQGPLPSLAQTQAAWTSFAWPTSYCAHRCES